MSDQNGVDMTLAGKRWVFSLKDMLQIVLGVAATASLIGTVLVWALPLLFPAWAKVPERIATVEAALQTLAAARPAIVAFSGAGIVSQARSKPGGTISVVYVLRRTIDCETKINARFWDHSTNTIIAGDSSPAVRSPVSPDFSAFAVRVKIPADLPPGRYSYLPEIVPVNCGVYGAITPPMSEAFEVTE